MNRLVPALIAAILTALPLPALAQNSSGTAPAPSAPPKTETPPATTPPSATPPETVQPAEPAPTIVVQPAPQAAPQQPVTISPDAAYPNGFADPADPFANEASAYNDNQGGFDWGLLGLLGLLGLIPLIRGNGRRTIYVERDEPRRVVRERIDE
ncbi:MAG TPA: hypothetical protein VES64_05890 [Allosphingosinicella sp.]|nr:hypothetical protein [Allosphingosinicella sp.]